MVSQYIRLIEPLSDRVSQRCRHGSSRELCLPAFSDAQSGGADNVSLRSCSGDALQGSPCQGRIMPSIFFSRSKMIGVRLLSIPTIADHEQIMTIRTLGGVGPPFSLWLKVPTLCGLDTESAKVLHGMSHPPSIPIWRLASLTRFDEPCIYLLGTE